jgi:DNA modification methylase
VTETDLKEIIEAARTNEPVVGLTHDFYAYPARFSPAFVASAIKTFSRPGDLVVDPFMGGATTVVEGLAAGRRTVGSDVNSLAVFLAKVKTTTLTPAECTAVRDWIATMGPCLNYHAPREQDDDTGHDSRARNLTLPHARPIRKAVAIALAAIGTLPTEASRNFIRCVLLRTGQWALDSRKRRIHLSEFRARLRQNAELMLHALGTLGERLRQLEGSSHACVLLQTDATNLADQPFFQDLNNQADLVVTSPPYPGIHVLYHRWQVDGRRESPAPYWIADCHDGQGGAFYTFGDRRNLNLTGYFETLRATFRSIRKIMSKDGHLVQMVSFDDRRRHLQRYLYAMQASGFVEVKEPFARRIWRDVPNRKWHASLKGKTSASREVVLIHRPAD